MKLNWIELKPNNKKEICLDEPQKIFSGIHLINCIIVIHQRFSKSFLKNKKQAMIHTDSKQGEVSPYKKHFGQTEWTLNGVIFISGHSVKSFIFLFDLIPIFYQYERNWLRATFLYCMPVQQPEGEICEMREIIFLHRSNTETLHVSSWCKATH